MNTMIVASGLGLALYIDLRKPTDQLSLALTIDKVVADYFTRWSDERRADLAAQLKHEIRRRDQGLAKLQATCAAVLAINKARYT